MENLIYIILSVILVLILIIFVKYNKLIKLQNRVKKAKANIEIYLNKRFDLIPNLVETIKGYSNYESSTLEDIVKLRNNYQNQRDLTAGELNEVNNNLNKYLLIVEKYPELKANEGYLNLQNKLSSLEDEIQRQRHIYNDYVTDYNTAIETVPSNIVASLFNFKQADLFKIDDSKRENVKIDL